MLIQESGYTKFYLKCDSCYTSLLQYSLDSIFKLPSGWELTETGKYRCVGCVRVKEEELIARKERENFLAQVQPCPSCNSKNLSLDYEDEDRIWTIECQSCGLMMPSHNGHKIDVINRWNELSKN